MSSAAKLAILAGAALAVWAEFASSAYPQNAPTRTADGYIDSGICATCHREIAENYRQTGMGRSFYRPNEAEEYPADRHFYDQRSDTHFSMTQRASGLYQRRWQLGLKGEEINAEEAKVDYVMGSGNHARSYVTKTAAGTLIELPLGWFPVPGDARGRWDMAPGSDTTHPLTRRFISYKCMFCHNGIPEIPKANEVPGADPVFAGHMPEGIDCQRCHGPGAAHVRAVSRAGTKKAGIWASIVNPARLNPARAMDVCIQCHLETTSTRIPATLVRFSRAPFSFKPGENFGDFAISFDHAPGTGHDDKFETVSSVYRLRQSKCFTQSAGRLICQTCHDPHRVPRGEEATKHYAAVCNQCHDSRQGGIPPVKSLTAAGRHPAGGDCTACHMPKRRADDIPRLTMTDHFIRSRPPLQLVDLPAPSTDLYIGEIVTHYPATLGKTGDDALYSAIAQVGLGNNLTAGLPRLEEEIKRNSPRDAEFYMVLGDARQAAGKYVEAVSAYEQALRVHPGWPRGLRAVAGALQESGNLSIAEEKLAEEKLKEALRLGPVDPETWYRYGLLDQVAGRLPQAAEKVARAVALDPSLPEKSRKLAEIHLQLGDLDRTEAALKDALRINPYDDDAWDLSGRLHSQKGEVPEAVFAFEKAVRLRPDSAEHLYDFALALARAGRMQEAEERAEAAIRADSKLLRAQELLVLIRSQIR